MISPQEQGTAGPTQLTVTLLGDEIGSLLAWLDVFPQHGPCVSGQEDCDGIRPEPSGLICLDCADMVRVGNSIMNLREEIKRQWQTATQ